MSKCKTIAICNQKGGVGKTTTAVNLGVGLAMQGKTAPIVSTDAVYRQTYYKEELWRSKGAVGVDMETSALFSVGRCLGVNVVSILIASDKHPKNESAPKWKWTMTKEMRYRFFDQCIHFALQI